MAQLRLCSASPMHRITWSLATGLVSPLPLPRFWPQASATPNGARQGQSGRLRAHELPPCDPQRNSLSWLGHLFLTGSFYRYGLHVCQARAATLLAPNTDDNCTQSFVLSIHASSPIFIASSWRFSLVHLLFACCRLATCLDPCLRFVSLTKLSTSP